MRNEIQEAITMMSEAFLILLNAAVKDGLISELVAGQMRGAYVQLIKREIKKKFNIDISLEKIKRPIN